MLKDRTDLLYHERKHLSFLKDNAYECALFLKRDNAFPISKTNITLVGNGVRYTVIGGTGSGAVNVRYKEGVEEAFESAGFTIDSKEWLDAYDAFKIENEKDFVKKITKEAHEHHAIAAAYAMGRLPLEGEFEYFLPNSGEVAIYVLSRNGGEGSDRLLEKGDVKLTDSEIKTINYLNNNFKKFLLVLNVPGVIDIEPVLGVSNILYLSQLGSLTGELLVDIVTGRANPSGKLTTSWARIRDYPYISTPINHNETRYSEGIYVGYRYFSSKGISTLFPFGYGLSYSDFNFKVIDISNSKDEITLKVNVKNTSAVAGKEVIQAYISHNGNKMAKLNLVAFVKSDIIEGGKEKTVTLSFNFSDFPIFDEKDNKYYIEKGDYLIKVGNSSDNLTNACLIRVKNDVTIKQVKSIVDKPDFDDLIIDINEEYNDKKLQVIELDENDFFKQNINYLPSFSVKIPEFINTLSLDDLILLSLGDYKTGITGLIGQSCSLVSGGAGETTLRVKGVDCALNMVDGPAGLRLTQEYILNKNGLFPVSSDSIWEGISKYIPKFLSNFLDPKRNLKKKGSRVYQIATALPIATALAQSFNPEFVEDCGRLVKEEMKIYGVDIWLAPALNIHRHILCGRNFEYYSEDPLLSASMASAITLGVQENSNKVVTIKHFCCNNIEMNRLNNNSMISEKALREIYLPGFEKTIRWSNPLSIMTSYNLVNGEHTSSHKGLLIDVLRSEWNYEGLIMTDWVSSGQSYRKDSKYSSNYASRNIKNGNNICMPGSKKDIKDIKRAIKKGYLSIDELRNNAAMVYNFINKIKGIEK